MAGKRFDGVKKRTPLGFLFIGLAGLIIALGVAGAAAERGGGPTLSQPRILSAHVASNNQSATRDHDASQATSDKPDNSPHGPPKCDNDHGRFDKKNNNERCEISGEQEPPPKPPPPRNP
jgi:hypothetical protein